MMTIVDANLILLVIALVIGFVIGWWMFRRPRTGGDIKLDVDTQSRPYLDPPEPQPDQSPSAMLRERSPVAPTRTRPIRDGIDTNERRGLLDEGAAATTDVAGQLLGIRAHAELPGASEAEGEGPIAIARWWCPACPPNSARRRTGCCHARSCAGSSPV